MWNAKQNWVEDLAQGLELSVELSLIEIHGNGMFDSGNVQIQFEIVNFIGPFDEPWVDGLSWSSIVEHMKELKVVQAHIFVVGP